MPIIKSAKKALRQSKRRQKINKKRKEEMKQAVKKLNKLVLNDKKKKAAKLIPETYKAIDKAVKGGIIKKNTANRKKSQIAKKVQK